MGLAQRSGDMEFSIFGREGYELVEGVTQFKYLGRPLDQSDNGWPKILRNTRRLRKFWGQMGKILLWEGEDTHVLAIFYWVVVQAVLLFRS